MQQCFPTRYRFKIEDVNLIITNWEEEWKKPRENKGPSEEDEDQEKIEEENDQMDGTSNIPSQSTVLEEGIKKKDKGPKQAGQAQKKFNVQKKTKFIS
jgi:hypothetical protein